MYLTIYTHFFFYFLKNTSTETNVLITETSKWACCPEENRHHVLKQDDHFRFTCERTGSMHNDLSEQSLVVYPVYTYLLMCGWMLYCLDSTISILVPWEDRVFNLREIVEDEHLSKCV